MQSRAIRHLKAKWNKSKQVEADFASGFVPPDRDDDRPIASYRAELRAIEDYCGGLSAPSGQVSRVRDRLKEQCDARHFREPHPKTGVGIDTRARLWRWIEDRLFLLANWDSRYALFGDPREYTYWVTLKTAYKYMAFLRMPGVPTRPYVPMDEDDSLVELREIANRLERSEVDAAECLPFATSPPPEGEAVETADRKSLADRFRGLTPCQRDCVAAIWQSRSPQTEPRVIALLGGKNGAKHGIGTIHRALLDMKEPDFGVLVSGAGKGRGSKGYWFTDEAKAYLESHPSELG